MRFLTHALASLGLALAALAGPAATAEDFRTSAQARAERLASEGRGPLAWTGFQSCLEAIQKWGPDLPDWIVHSRPLPYSARKPVFDAAGHAVLDSRGEQVTTPVQLTGRIFFPPGWRMAQGAGLPLVVYAHATELKKDAVPSVFGGKEWMLGAAAAAWFGFAVAMPDLPGMGGDSATYHPYCHAKSLAYALVDGIAAMGRVFAEDPYLAERGVVWNGQLFLVGYSEGGYTSLSAVKELETHPGAYPFALTGSACMAGPFDLSGTMRSTFIDPHHGYPRSYYLPYFVRGYHAVYGPRLDPREVFAPSLLEASSAGDILTWTDGTQDGLDVDAEMGKRLGMPADSIVLRDMFNVSWLSRSLLDPAYASSPVHALLEENDLYRSWRPTKPILFRQSPDDVNIPCANTQKAVEGLGAEIRKAGGDPQKLLFSWPIGKPGDGIPHTEGAYIAIPSAFAWIYFGMPEVKVLAACRW